MSRGNLRRQTGVILKRSGVLLLTVLALGGCGGGGPATPPANLGRIVFQSNPTGTFDIAALNGNGTGQLFLTRDPANDTEPNYRFDGQRIVFVSDRDGNSEIYAMNDDGTTPLRLTNNNYEDDQPVFNFDGSHIAFRARPDGINSDLFLIGANGGPAQPLTTHPAFDFDPAFLPDGRLLFVSDRSGATGGGNFEIYRRENNGEATRLTNNASNQFSPVASPDGQRIAFVSDREGQNEIYIMAARGGAATRLTTNAASDIDPAFTRDGRALIFSSDRSGNFDLYRLDLQTRDATPVFTSLTLDRNPDAR